jgi:transposase-like protein
MLKVVSSQRPEFNLDEMIREGVKEMLAATLEAEVTEYIEKFKTEVDESGHRRVVRNGYSKSRRVTTTAGNVEVRAPRVNDQREGEKFISKVLPPYLRSSAKVENLIPVLYLRGLSTGKISETLKEYFEGEGSMGLSPASVSKLLKSWEKEFDQFKHRKISKNYVYLWADGVNVRVRLGDDKKICLLVIIGVTEDGDKELLAVQDGYRESKEAWGSILRNLVVRGLRKPLLTIGDGALGFWSALRDIEEFDNTEEQRCWVHKIANVLNKLPKRVQPEAKALLHEMMKAPDRTAANTAKKVFEETFNDKYSKAVECLAKDWKQLTTFFDYPAKHWTSLRTTNPIESAFATVKLRTKSTRGAGSSVVAAALAFKLLKEAEKKWRKIRGHEEIQKLVKGVVYKDGVVVGTSSTDHKAVVG